MIGVLSKAQYYNSPPQGKPIVTFTGETEDDIKSLAIKYLRNFKTLDRPYEKFRPNVWYKNAEFDSKNRYWFSDDEVVTSWVLNFVPNYSDPSEFPPAKCTITSAGIIKIYRENPEGGVDLEIIERT